MSGPHIVALGNGELVEIGQISMEILEDGSLTDHRLAVARFGIPPHTVSDLAKRNALTVENVRQLMARYHTEVVQ